MNEMKWKTTKKKHIEPYETHAHTHRQKKIFFCLIDCYITLNIIFCLFLVLITERPIYKNVKRMYTHTHYWKTYNENKESEKRNQKWLANKYFWSWHTFVYNGGHQSDIRDTQIAIFFSSIETVQRIKCE